MIVTITEPRKYFLVLAILSLLVSGVKNDQDIVTPRLLSSTRVVRISIRNLSNTPLTNFSSYMKYGDVGIQPGLVVAPQGSVGISAANSILFAGVEGVICCHYGDHDLVIYLDNPWSSSNTYATHIFLNRHLPPGENWKAIGPYLVGATVPVTQSNALFDLSMKSTGGDIATEDVILVGKTVAPAAPSGPNPRSRVSYFNTQLRGWPGAKVDLTTNNSTWEKWTWNHLGDNKYTWKSAFNTYLRAYPGGQIDLAPWAQEWETWTKITLTNGKNVWKSYFNTYLCAHPEGTLSLVQEPKEWEQWTD